MNSNNTIDFKELILLNKLAAFIDSDGTIGIGRKRHKSRNFGYQQYIQLANSDVRLIQWAVDNFGGKFPKAVPLKENRKDAYRWMLFGHDSYNIIKKIRPYLILKYEQADCAIELYETVSARFDRYKPLTGWKKRRAEEIFQICKELNKIGKNDNDGIEVLVPMKVAKECLEEWIM